MFIFSNLLLTCSLVLTAISLLKANCNAKHFHDLATCMGRSALMKVNQQAGHLTNIISKNQEFYCFKVVSLIVIYAQQ